ncbi:MAG: PEP-CTERM sorting domain-containing protein [Rubrivivax sp.]|nr:MAG: PEP-CTERM sorting domain-containing protein [Rubrivivax sp.]
MRAYDAANNLLGSAVSGGGAFNQGVLGLSGLGAIAKVTWSTGSDIAAVGIDQLNFTPAVPEPGTWALLGAGLLVVPLALRRRRA